MLDQSILIAKISGRLRQSKISAADLSAACGEIRVSYDFDGVFLAFAPIPEESLTLIASDGNEEIVESSIYRLGIEERLSLTKIPIKEILDTTGKPVFNKSGSLRIQKPGSGIFMALHRPSKSFIVFGCSHMNTQPYPAEILDAIASLWMAIQEPMERAVLQLLASGEIKIQKPAGSPEPAESPAVSPAPSATAVETNPAGNKQTLRPLILVDETTRLFNKDYFKECLSVEVERAHRHSRHVSLIFISATPYDNASLPSEVDIAHQMVEVLMKSLRKVDIICYVGKNRYALILPDTSGETHSIIARRIFKKFKEMMGSAPTIYLNVSAVTYPKHAPDAKGLFEKAEQLLAQAQQVGPNKAVLPD